LRGPRLARASAWIAATIAASACSFPSVEYDGSTDDSTSAASSGGDPCAVPKNCSQKATSCAADVRANGHECALECLLGDTLCLDSCAASADNALVGCTNACGNCVVKGNDACTDPTANCAAFVNQ
jgi:hypothetical protein